MSDADASSDGRGGRTIMGLVYALAGVSHLLAPAAFERIVPPGLPRPRALVYLSGVAEIVLGVGVLFERTRRASAWGIVALLIAVFPANVYMATDDVAAELVPDWAAGPARLAAWARLPLQAVLVGWAWLYTRPSASDR
jgi:uncharacterized membrane protein